MNTTNRPMGRTVAAAIAWMIVLSLCVLVGATYGGNAAVTLSSSGGSVTAPATGAGTDTCTGAGCAIGAAGITVDGGITLGNSTASIIQGGGAVVRLSDSAGAVIGYSTNTLTLGGSGATFTQGVASSIASGSVAFQSVTGAKTCFGTGGVACWDYNGSASHTTGNTTIDGNFNASNGCFTTTSSTVSLACNTALATGMGFSVVSKMIINTAPTVTGFGTSPSVVANNGTAAFTINVGTGGTANTGTITLPAATTGWVCTCFDVTTPASFVIGLTGGSTTTCTIASYARTTGLLTAWTASDILRCTAVGY